MINFNAKRGGGCWYENGYMGDVSVQRCMRGSGGGGVVGGQFICCMH